jgi:DNA-binding response OmpR family regulator
MPLRVLLIEDDQMIRTILTESLTEEGFEVSGLANAEDAIILLGAGDVPDVLVTDIDLGAGLDGHDLARMAQTNHPDVGIVFISGRYSDSQHQSLRDHERFLLKPFTLPRLVKSIRDAAGDCSAARSLSHPD